MPVEILMPALSPTMTEGKLIKWYKAEGDAVKSAEAIAEIETDKATMEVEATEDGTLGKIVVQAGTEKVPVNSVIGLILLKGESKDALNEVKIAPCEAAAPETKVTEPKCEISKQNDITEPSNRIFISPLAKRMAGQHNLDITSIEGSGPRGRIVKSDILANLDSTSKVRTSLNTKTASTQSISASPFDKVDISRMRKAVANTVEENKLTVPHFYLSMDYEMSKLLELRSDINKTYAKETASGRGLSVTDLIIKALALAVAEVPEANVSWHKTYIARYHHVDVSIAVSVENGVIIPAIRQCESKSVFEISKELESLAARARAGQVKADELTGGSFTISNLGMFGIDSFEAILNAPQSMIFAIGATKKKPVVKEDKIVIGQIMNITASCDHRVIDGALAALVMNKIKEYIENPARLLI